MNAEDVRSAPTRYVGFWLRVVATLVDTVALLALRAPIVFAVYGSDGLGQFTANPGVAGFVINYVLPFVAVMVFWRTRGATPGKMVIGAVIVDAGTGGAPATWQLVVRYLGYYLSGLVLGLGFFWVGWDARKQGWHDKLAGTVVVSSRG
jgi:uncharacterized RDD family membrane protein YckC